MRRPFTLLVVLVSTTLGGCYISDKPLVSARDAVFPYKTISYREAKGDEIMTMKREGDSYVMRKDGSSDRLDLRFRKIGKDLYLAQASADQDGKPAILYAVVKVDWKRKRAESYKAVAEMSEEGPGLRKCGSNELCIDDLRKYLKLAEKAVATGEPDATYEIVEAK